MNNGENKKFGLTDVFMLLTVVIWALNFSFIKIALRELSPHGFNGIRLLLTSLFLLLWLGLAREGLTVEKQDLWKLVILSFFGNAIYQVFFIQGLQLSTASNTSLILSMNPIIVALFSSFLKYEKIHWAGWSGIFISFAGLYLIISRQNGSLHISSEYLKGDLMIFVGTFIWALFTVLAKPFLERISPLKFTTVTMVFGTIFYLPFAARDMLHIPWLKISFEAWASLLFSAIFALVIGIVIWYQSVKRVGNSKTAIYSNLTPLFTAFFASLFLSEKILPFQVVGAIIILSGVYLTRYGYRYFMRKVKN